MSVLQQRSSGSSSSKWTKSGISKVSSSSSKSNISKTPSVFSVKQISPTSVRTEKSYDSSAKNAFSRTYKTVCAKYKTRPSRCVTVNNRKNFIEISGESMKVEDWQAILETLSVDTSAHHVRINNRRQKGKSQKSYETLYSTKSTSKNELTSDTHFVGRLIASSIYEILVNSHAIVYLELQNILFDVPAMEMLISGIKANQTLQQLSLQQIRIDDNVCLSLCRALRDKPNVRSLNLSGCSLSPASATNGGLVDLIRKQQIRRHEECWAHSLRYRSANPDMMSGLRRLTLNDNAGLGDDGVAELLEVLKDDLYIKAVDLQNCGLTDRGCRLAISTLTINDTLVVLDVRKNGVISAAALETVMTQLYNNNVGKPDIDEWKWTHV